MDRRKIRSLNIFGAGLVVGLACATYFSHARQRRMEAEIDPAEAALDRRLPEVRIYGKDLLESLAELSHQWHVPIQYDTGERNFGLFAAAAGAEDAPPSPPPNVSIRANNATLADVLDEYLTRDRNNPLDYSIRNGVIHVSPSPDAIVRAYDVRDLIAPPKPAPPASTSPILVLNAGLFGGAPPSVQSSASELEESILDFLGSRRYSSSTLRRVGTELILTSTCRGHRIVRQLLQELRHPRKVDPTATPGFEIRKWDHALHAWACIDASDREQSRLLAARRGRLRLKNVRLEDALDVLRDRWQTTILIDRAALNRADAKWEEQVTVDLADPSLSEALRVVLGDWGNDRGISVSVDNGSVVITAASQLLEGKRTRAYQLGDWVQRCDPAPLLGPLADAPVPSKPITRLIAYIKENVNPESWGFQYAAISEYRGMLIVTQSWTNLEEVDAILSKLKAFTDAADKATTKAAAK